MDIAIARAMVPLLGDARYKAAYGGRAGTKSHFFAEQIVLQGRVKTLRVACIREIQNTLKESVRQLIVDKITTHGHLHEWDILDGEIRHKRTGTLIIFKGMQAYNADNIKSLEGFDIVWVEEAQTLSARSLRILRPTIRKAGSQLWFSWNPRHESDAVDQFFRGQEPPPDAIIVEVSYRDNPWLSDEIKREIAHDFATDPDMAEHVWNGGYEIITEGSYYAKLVRKAEQEGRIGDFPYDPQYRLRTAWDIGVDDYTAVWFIQDNGHYPWVVDYVETNNVGADEIVQTYLPELDPDTRRRVAALIELRREVPFTYERHFLPHDVMVREWGAGAKSRYQTLMGLGVKPIHTGARVGPEERIAATRKLLPITRFNNTKRVQVGLARLRRYSRKFNEQLQVWEGPLKDLNTHGADAFGEYAYNCGILPAPEKKPEPTRKDELVLTAVKNPDGTTSVVGNLSVKEIIALKEKEAKNR